MKGIILAGGNATRLYPATISLSKHLIPIYDKPMIYYPLSSLMLAGIKDILIIVNERDLNSYKKLLQDGSHLGISIKYLIQKKPKGIADALIIGEDFIADDKVALILGDNIFYGHAFSDILLKAKKLKGASIFGYPIKDPKRFGIANINKKTKKLISIEEKPNNPKSNIAITGLYFYDNKACKFAKSISPSARNEIEITDVNKMYLKNNKLNLIMLNRGFTWLDTGTPNSLIEASEFVQIIEERQGYKIACVEEIAWRQKWISTNHLKKLSRKYKSTYGLYLKKIITI